MNISDTSALILMRCMYVNSCIVGCEIIHAESA